MAALGLLSRLIGAVQSLQTGSVSEADYEALVLKLHEIEVRCSRAVGGWEPPPATLLGFLELVSRHACDRLLLE